MTLTRWLVSVAVLVGIVALIFGLMYLTGHEPCSADFETCAAWHDGQR